MSSAPVQHSKFRCWLRGFAVAPSKKELKGSARRVKMFVGHIGVGLAAKRFTPKTSVGTLIAAALLFDLVWIVLLNIGLERVTFMPGITPTSFNPNIDYFAWEFPYSHSLLLGAVWGVAFAACHFRRRRDTQAAWIIFAAVLSYWVADFVTHKPDMQLAPGVDRYFGLGLWTSIPATVVVEGGVWVIGVVMFSRVTIPKNRIGTLAFWSIIVFLTYIWLLGPFTPLPADISADDAIKDLKTFNLI